jgi:hypothetical protein
LTVVAAIAVRVRLVRIRAVDIGFVVVEQPVLVGIGASLVLAAAAGIVFARTRMRCTVQRFGTRVDFPILLRARSL